MIDILLKETGNGGDAILEVSDLRGTDSFSNMVYLAWFGGNPGYPTTGNEVQGEQRFDWWGNSLLFTNEVDFQFNSTLEYVLNTTSLNSAGLITIENAAKDDLKFMSDFANVSVSVELVSDDKVSVTANIEEPSNLQSNEFQIIWDATKLELDFGGIEEALTGSDVVTPPAQVDTINVFLKGNFASGQLELNEITIDDDSAGVYTVINSDVLSGAITLSINGGADLPFSSPTTLEIGDTVVAKRASDIDEGFYKLIGTRLV